ncbi:MAG: DUF4412 domain-containing protein [Chlorobiaceae bacterium]|nr:DUF4412 domain-containing protein [Chlorobiaceae bacterium]NTV26231.1 DUF4412 domain-containing protein [Chlorobiaceae bacterium]
MNNKFARLFATLLVPGLLLSACKGKESSNSPAGSAVEQTKAPVIGPFEGVMYMSTTVPGAGTSEMKLYIGKKGVRTESSTGIDGQSGALKMTVISPAETPDKIYMINDAAGTCMEFDISKALHKDVNADPFKDAKIENLGSEKVNGYNCTHVRITRPGQEGTMEIWVTKEMLDYFTYVRMQGSRDHSMPKLAARLKDAGLDGFPVKTRINPSGIVTELTRIERTSLDDKLFQVPSNCTKMEVPTVAPGGAMSKEKIKEMQEFARKMQQQMKQ